MLDGWDVIWTVAAVAAGFLLKHWLQPFSAEKAKNLATRQDIGAITNEVETVKQVFAAEIEALKQQNALVLETMRGRLQLRLVAAEHRLEAHQRAFAIWRRAILHAHDRGGKMTEVFREGTAFFEERSLYLAAEARDAFSNALHAARQHNTIKNTGNGAAVKENWAVVMRGGDVILQCVDLPPLSQAEIADLPSDAEGLNPDTSEVL